MNGQIAGAYASGQVDILMPLLRERPPRWFIVAGPADGDEGQCIAAEFPACNVIGFEPNPKFRRWQDEHGFPGALSSCALWDAPGVLTIHVPVTDDGNLLDRSATAARDCTGTKVADLTVEAMRLDDCSFDLQEAVLWLDVEGAELQALRGAAELLRSGRIWCVNLEVMPEERPADVVAIEQLMGACGFDLHHCWNWRKDWHDRIYVKRKV